MSRFDVTPTALAKLVVLTRKQLGDQRGYLERMFCDTDLADFLGGKRVRQINRTMTAKKGTIRGLHYQRPPHAEVKFISCLRGEVWDVAVDLRHDSPTFMKFHSEILSADNRKTLMIPEGFAHGFQTLTDDCELLYLHTASFEASSEGGVSPFENRISISWPLSVSEISERDKAHAALAQNFEGIVL